MEVEIAEHKAKMESEQKANIEAEQKAKMEEEQKEAETTLNTLRHNIQ